MRLNKSMKTVLPLAVFAGLALAGTANAILLLSDDFSGSSGDNLNGTTPDVTTGAATWVATSNYKADGSFTLDSPATTTLAFTPVNGLIYTLDAQIETLGGGQWAQFGFGGSQTTDAIWTTRPWMLLRVAGSTSSGHNASAGSGTGTGGLAGWTSLNTLDYANDMDVRIVLDTTGGADNWTATWYAKAGNVGAYTEVRSEVTLTGVQDDITSVGFSTYNVANDGQFNSFSLSDNTVVPEPSSAALLGLGGLALIPRRRK